MGLSGMGHVTNAVDAPVNREQEALANPLFDLFWANPYTEQLRPGDNTMLPRSNFARYLLDRPAYRLHSNQESGQRRIHPARIRSAARSPIMVTGARVWPPVITGITEASATRRPSTPRTRSCGSTTAPASEPMRHVPTGW